MQPLKFKPIFDSTKIRVGSLIKITAETVELTGVIKNVTDFTVDVEGSKRTLSGTFLTAGCWTLGADKGIEVVYY